jgi:acyl-CoA oxidase
VRVFANVLTADCQWAGIFDRNVLRLIRGAISRLLDELRPECVALVDAFDIPDRVLNSTIGRSDGNVYEALYEAAKKSSLNLRDPFDGYEEVLRPKLDIEFLKTGNRVPANM